MPSPTESTRKLGDWLAGLKDYVEETEAPRRFWLWGGIFTICSALQRKVWLPYGIENIYPNLYIMLVGPPGSRKAGPLSLSKQMLLDLGLPVSADSSSKRALTKELAEISKGSHFDFKGKPRPQCPMAIISKEMSSLLAVDPKGMIEVLTDLFDSHDKWQYKTSGEGQDYLYGVCLSCFIATTPTWLEANLPHEAIGGGYTSRHIIITDTGIHKPVAIPRELDPKLYSMLVHDLNKISILTGEFSWGTGARDYFTDWYENELSKKPKQIKDERLHGFIARMHIHVLKAAMALRVSYSDSLILNSDDIGHAIDMVDGALVVMGSALGGHGRSKVGGDIEKLLARIQLAGQLSETEIARGQFLGANPGELDEILKTIVRLKYVKPFYDEKGNSFYEWIKQEES